MRLPIRHALVVLKSIRISSMSWNIHEIIKEFGFSQNVDESCVYKKVSGSAIVFLMLYVDDILLMKNDISFLK